MVVEEASIESCTNCKSKIIVGTIFCPYCGSNLRFPKKLASIDEIAIKDDIDTDYLKKFKEIEQKMAEYDGIEIEVQQQKDHYQMLYNERERAKNNLRMLKTQMESELEDVEELKKLNWKSIKARFKGEHDDLLKKEEAEYLEVLHRLEAAEIEVEIVNKKLQCAEEDFDKIKKIMEGKQILQMQLSKLINDAAEGVKDAIEDKIELKLNELTELVEPHLLQKSRLQTAFGFSQNALEMFKISLEMLKEDDIVGNALLVQSVKSSKMAEIRDFILNASQSVNATQEIFKQIEIEEHSTIIEGTNFWDNFIKTFMAQIKRGMSSKDQTNQEIIKAIQDINKLLSWINSQIKNIDREISENFKEIYVVQQELTKERERMIREAIQKTIK